MVEHNDDFGSSVPLPSPPPEGDLGGQNYGEPGGLEPLEPGEMATLQDPIESHEAAFKDRQHAPETINEGTKHPAFPMLLGGALLLTLGIAWAVNSKPSESATTAAAPDATASPAPETPSPVAELHDGVKSLRSEIDGIRTDLKTLQDRLESMPKPVPLPDLEPLNRKIADLAKDTESLAALPEKMGALDQRIGALDKTLAAQKEDIEALKSEVKKAVDQAAPKLDTTATATTTATKPEDVDVSDSAMESGVDLFKAGKYKEASDVFKKLTETNPDDARVWYYAALSRGSATKQWTGETTRLVEKGVEREKAGSPETSKIDTLFANLNPAFKPWLDAYRKAIKPR
jgi:TolA-binding protein